MSKLTPKIKASESSQRERVKVIRRPIKAKYDAAQTTPSNMRHWMNADGLSATAANSESVRKTLRERSRYEIANSPYAKGIVETIADDTVGTGPRLQLRSGMTSSKTDEIVEDEFRRWAKLNKLSAKMRLARKSKCGSGEVFALLVRGHKRRPSMLTLHQREEVELGIKLVEADQVATPTLLDDSAGKVSGIVFDQYGNPETYHVLKHHPGDAGALSVDDFDHVPAEQVLHYFEQMRPGDARGVPELTPALELFAYDRRYMSSTVEAAEHLANIALLLRTIGPADGDITDEERSDDDYAPEPLDSFDIERGQMLTLPDGYDISQPKAEQPTATFVEFHNAIIGAIARALNIPFNVAAGNSSGYNYASGRLDHQGYHKSIRIEREKIVETLLDPIFEAWFSEAVLIEGLLPEEARSEDYRRSLRTTWFWDGFGHVDPTKEAQGQKLRLESGTTTLAIEAAREGFDWKDILTQQSEELKLRKKLGLPTPTSSKPSAPTNRNEDLEEEEAGETEDAEKQGANR